MNTTRSQPAKAFRPGDPREYDYAQELLAARGRTISDYLHACLRWLNTEPDTALNILMPVWPPPRATGRRVEATAYAVRDETGQWLGKPHLLPDGQYADVLMSTPFMPADPYNPLAGQQLLVRCGAVPEDAGITPYTVRVRGGDGNEAAVRIIEAVQNVLFGPPTLGTPARAAWDAAREQRKRELDAADATHA